MEILIFTRPRNKSRVRGFTTSEIQNIQKPHESLEGLRNTRNTIKYDGNPDLLDKPHIPSSGFLFLKSRFQKLRTYKNYKNQFPEIRTY